MPEPKIEATPVVVGVNPPPVVELKSSIIVPEGESPPAGFANPPNETEGREKPVDAAAGDNGSEGEGAAKEGAAGDSDASIDAEGAGDVDGSKASDDAQRAAGGTEDAEKAKKSAEAAEALQKKRFLQIQAESAQLARDAKKLKEDRQAIEQQEKTFKSKVEAYDNATRLAKEDPVKLLELLGVSFETLTAAMLSKKDGVPPEVANIQKEMEALKADRQKEKDDQAETEEKAVATRQQANLDGYYDRLRAVVDKSDEYTLVKLQGDAAIKQAVDGAALHYKNYGVLPSDQELLAATEGMLVKQTTDALGTEKFKKLFPGLNPDSKSGADDTDVDGKEAGKAAEGAAENEPDDKSAKAATTLANKMQGTGGPRKGAGLKDRDSSVAEASTLLKW